MTAVALEIVGLGAGYPHRRVIHGLSLPPMPAGTVSALIGPNGAGKTTLLRALGGMLPANGQARFAGRNLIGRRPLDLARLVGYMPQALPRGVALTVIEAVVTALRAAPMEEGSSPLRARADAMLDRLGIADLALTPLDRLSGGQRQLVSLAQAVVRRPAILLLDEPTSALDPRHRGEVMSAVREIALADRIVVLVVLHEVNLALRWADMVVMLAHGELVAAGPPAGAVTADTLARLYGIEARVERCARGRPYVLFD